MQFDNILVTILKINEFDHLTQNHHERGLIGFLKMNLKLLITISFSMSIIQAPTNGWQKNTKLFISKPILTAIDENYVLVNYQNIDPLPVNRIDLRRNTIFAAADSSYNKIKYYPTSVYQPLHDNKTMIGRLDTCRDYEDLILRTDGLL